MRYQYRAPPPLRIVKHQRHTAGSLLHYGEAIMGKTRRQHATCTPPSSKFTGVSTIRRTGKWLAQFCNCNDNVLAERAQKSPPPSSALSPRDV